MAVNKINVQGANHDIHDARDTTGVISQLSYDSVNGKIDASKPIIEDMTGYSMTIGTITNVTLTPVYGGIVRNGNKLTIVFATNIKRTGAVSPSALCTISVPASVGSKIYVSVGSITVSRTKAYCVDIDGYVTTDKEVPCSLTKQSNTSFPLIIYEAAGILENNTDYYLRLEMTLLLSDNLLA